MQFSDLLRKMLTGVRIRNRSGAVLTTREEERRLCVREDRD